MFVLSGLLVLALGVVLVGLIEHRRLSADVALDPPNQLPFSPASEYLSLAGNLWLDTSDREAVELFYEQEFAKEPPKINWTGEQDACDAGLSSDKSKEASIDRVNFYRAMAGVPAIVSLDSNYSAKAHSGALMMSAEGQLTHDPSPNFACYTTDGYDAASNSNLYLGRTGPYAIDGYVEDPGDGNADVGHRNTLLHPPTVRMGVANVEARGGYDESNLLWVFDENVFEVDYETREQEGFVAWPPAGYTPADIVHPRWSFGLAGANFSQAEITMIQSGEPVPLEVVTREGKEGRVPNPIMVWEPIFDLDSDEETFDIEISKVLVEGEEKSFRYSTSIFSGS